MNKNLLRECVRIAQEYLHKHPELAHYPHYSFLVQNNKIVEWSTNAAAVSHPRYPRGSKLHAEARMWDKGKGLIDKRKKFEVVNIRLNKQAQLRLSAPCLFCHSFLWELGCSKVYYSTTAGEFESLILN